jgi:hypothetical protein
VGLALLAELTVLAVEEDGVLMPLEVAEDEALLRRGRVEEEEVGSCGPTLQVNISDFNLDT